jgi:hypothetical protein
VKLIGDSQLAKQFHPDINKDKGAHERFVEIQTAYDVGICITPRDRHVLCDSEVNSRYLATTRSGRHTTAMALRRSKKASTLTRLRMDVDLSVPEALGFRTSEVPSLAVVGPRLISSRPFLVPPLAVAVVEPGLKVLMKLTVETTSRPPWGLASSMHAKGSNDPSLSPPSWIAKHVQAVV